MSVLCIFATCCSTTVKPRLLHLNCIEGKKYFLTQQPMNYLPFFSYFTHISHRQVKLLPRATCLKASCQLSYHSSYCAESADFSNRCLTSFPMNKGQGVKVRNLFFGCISSLVAHTYGVVNHDATL